MAEGDVDPRLILAVLLAGAAIALAFFGFLHWRRRAARRQREASRTGGHHGALEGPPVTRSHAPDQFTSSVDAPPNTQSALVESWIVRGVGAKLAAIWLVLFTLLWLSIGIFPVALLFSFIGFGLSHVLIGPGTLWANLLLFVPLLVAGAAAEAFQPQDWRALALVLFLIPIHIVIWIGRTVRGGLRRRQHKVSALLLLLLLMLCVAIFGELLPDCPIGGLGGC